MNNFCVYKHTSPSGKVYIGITSQKPKDRWDSGHGYKNNIYFSRAIQKYGWANITHEVLLEGLTKSEAETKEKELIALYKSSDRHFGYNIALGGHINCFSEETRLKMSNSHKGKKLSIAQREKLSIAFSGENHPFYGKHHTEEARKKISENQKGRKPWCTGLKLTAEHRAKISSSHMGLKPSKETIEKWKKSNQEKLRPVERIDKNTNEVVYYFASIQDALKTTGIDASSITKCCRGKRKSAGDYKWRYAIETKAS